MNAYSITDECVGCGLCARICPVGAISGKRKEQHIIDDNACVRCGACGRMCANGAVRDNFGRPTMRVPRKEWARPVFDASCAGCSLCVISCPKDCIQICAPAFQGDIRTAAYLANPEDCLGCGLCVSACPIDAVILANQPKDQ